MKLNLKIKSKTKYKKGLPKTIKRYIQKQKLLNTNKNLTNNYVLTSNEDQSFSKSTNNNILNYSRIHSIIKRVIPNLNYNLQQFDYLYNNKNIKSYFKGIRSYVLDSELYDFLKNKGFDMSLADKIIKQIPDTKNIFHENIQNFPALCYDTTKYKGMCKVTNNHIKFLNSRVINQIFPGYVNNTDIPFKFPAIEDVILSVNRRASFGLPDPFIKKRDAIPELTNFLSLFYEQKLSISDLFHYPAAVFMRLQIRGSGMKVRLVHAVNAFQQIIESFYYLWFVSGIPKGKSAIAIGLTQIEVSKLTQEFKHYNTVPLDHTTWDLLKQPVLSVISFEIMLNMLPLSGYFRRMLIGLRNLFITLPSFHPKIQLRRRYVGTVSGSGFTSLDNSLANWAFVNLVFFEYCIIKGLDPYSVDYKFYVLGDDILFGSEIDLDVPVFSEIALKMFGNKLKLDAPVAPKGVDECFFLGSKWVEGKPIRDENLIVAAIVLSTPSKLPPMTMQERLQSRFIEIAGNSSTCSKLWGKLGLKLRKRLYFYRSLYLPFKTGDITYNKRIEQYAKQGVNTEKYSSGFWFDTNFTENALDFLWTYR